MIDKHKLSSVYLYSNNIGDKGVIALSEVFKNSSIENFYLHYNKIGDDGAIALAEAFKVNNNID